MHFVQSMPSHKYVYSMYIFIYIYTYQYISYNIFYNTYVYKIRIYIILLLSSIKIIIVIINIILIIHLYNLISSHYFWTSTFMLPTGSTFTKALNISASCRASSWEATCAGDIWWMIPRFLSCWWGIHWNDEKTTLGQPEASGAWLSQ